MYRHFKISRITVTVLLFSLCLVLGLLNNYAAQASSSQQAVGDATITFGAEKDRYPDSGNGKEINRGIDTNPKRESQKTPPGKLETVEVETVYITSPNASLPDKALPVTGSNNLFVFGLLVLGSFSLVFYFVLNQNDVPTDQKTGCDNE